MKNLKLTFLITVLVTWVSAFAQVNTVPMMMNYQGKISDSEGNPLNEEVLITFSLYADSAGGVALWSEMQEPVDVSDGIFHVLLGSAEDFPENLFDGSTLWLGINVNNDGEMTPRSLLSSVPYSLKTASAGPDDDWIIDGENIYRENGKVGIGITEPTAELEVAGTFKASNTSFLAAGVMGIGNSFGVYGEALGTGVCGKGGVYGIWGIADLSKSANAVAGYFDGKVGIGMVPQSQLDVAGGQINVRGKGAPINGTSLELTYNQEAGRGEILVFDRNNNEYKNLRIDGSQITLNNSTGSGNISIGTSGNEGKLHINNDEYAGPVLFLEGGSTNEGDIAWKSTEHLQIGCWDMENDAYSNVLTLKNDHSLGLYNMDGAERVNIKTSENGNDGAQLTLYDDEGNPSIVLDAQHGGQPGDHGRIITETLEITGGSDLSESFDISDDNAQEGMILCIDPENPGILKLSEKQYDKCVAGIISGAGGVNTGMIMGQQGTIANGKVPVALTGRVYCMASTENGPIAPGDLLTTSNLQGHAMKVSDHSKAQGAIIGKAMSCLKEGNGLVLVLVTLQ